MEREETCNHKMTMYITYRTHKHTKKIAANTPHSLHNKAKQMRPKESTNDRQNQMSIQKRKKKKKSRPGILFYFFEQQL